MKKSHIFSVLKVEGLHGDLSLAGCYITIDGRLYDVVTPLNSHIQENLLELPKEGTLRLIMKTMSQGDDILGSISIPVSSLPEFGLSWLPLFEKLDEDRIEGITQDVEFPRVLVSLNNVRILSPVQELDEMSTFNDCDFKQELEDNLPLSSFSTALDLLRGEECYDEKTLLTNINELQDHIRQLQSCHSEKENSMQIKILELEQNLHEEKWKFKHELGNIIHQTQNIEDEQALSYEKMKIQLKKSNIVKDDLQNQLRSMQDYLMKERDNRKEMENKVENIASRHNEEVKILHTQNNELRNLLKHAENSNHTLSQEMHKLKLQSSHLAQINSELETRFAHQEIKTTQVSLLGSKIQGLEILLKEANEARNELQRNVLELEEDRDYMNSAGLQPNDELLTEIRQLRDNLKEKDIIIQRLNCSLSKDETTELKLELKDCRQRFTRAQEDLQEYQKVVQFKQEEIKLLAEEYEKLKENYETTLKDSADLEAKCKELKMKADCAKSCKSKYEEYEDLDLAINEYLKTKHLENVISKVGDGVYNIGNKKVTVSLKNQIIVRVGGGYMHIDQFLHKHYLENSKSTENSVPSSKFHSPSCASLSPVVKTRNRRNNSMIASTDFNAEYDSDTSNKHSEITKNPGSCSSITPDDENFQPADLDKFQIFIDTPKNKLSHTVMISKSKKSDYSSKVVKNPLKERNFTPIRRGSVPRKYPFK